MNQFAIDMTIKLNQFDIDMTTKSEPVRPWYVGVDLNFVLVPASRAGNFTKLLSYDN